MSLLKLLQKPFLFVLVLILFPVFLVFDSPISRADQGHNLPSAEKLCFGNKVNYECGRTLEAEWLKRLSDKAYRKDLILTMRLDNGDTLTRISNSDEDFRKGWYGPDGEVNIGYVLTDYLKGSDFFQVEAFYYEGRDTELISRKDGTTYTFPGKPQWSPDRDQFFVIDENPYEAVTYSIQIWRVEKDKAFKELSYESEAWPLINVAWQESETLKVVVIDDSIFSGLSLNKGDLLGYFNLVNGSWIWMPETETETGAFAPVSV
jgi:hypothetical protein